MSTGTNDGVIELTYFLRNRTSYVRVIYKFYKYVHVGNSLIHSIFPCVIIITFNAGGVVATRSETYTRGTKHSLHFGT